MEVDYSLPCPMSGVNSPMVIVLQSDAMLIGRGMIAEASPCADAGAPRHAAALRSREEIAAGLSQYLKVAFKRRGEYVVRLAGDIIDVCTCTKDFARVALMLYESKCVTRMPRTFAVWFRTFGTIVGCGYSDYRKGSLGYKHLLPRFYYLEEYAALR